MNLLVNQLNLNKKDVDFFQENGFITLRGLLTIKAINGLREITRTSQLQKPLKNFYGDFAKMGYNLENSTLAEIYHSQELRAIFNQLTQKKLKFTQAMGFELEPQKTGFNWHVGIQAFHYIMPKDFACSLWIPLDPINTNEQHGGMAYVSRNIYSAYEYFSLMHQLVQSSNLSELLTAQDFHDSQYASKIESLILEKNKVEDNFEVGDALLFDKFVWHRSCILKEGKLTSRMAYVMRLIDGEARYSKTFLEGLDRSRATFGNPLQTMFGYKFSHLQDGEPISKSRSDDGE
ncbi:MAG: hypothetical protein SWX82_05565 [Cyanobacteriota bacterium]|nr:hypothetical protein [Cyanobacteriota bacterium]